MSFCDRRAGHSGLHTWELLTALQNAVDGVGQVRSDEAGD